MNQQASLKNQKFTVEIRRRQRQEIMKKEREACLAVQRSEQMKKNSIKDYENQNLKLNDKNVDQMYGFFLKSQNLLGEIPAEDVEAVIKIILVPSNLEKTQVLTMLGSMIMFLGTMNPKAQQQKLFIKQSFDQANIEQAIFQLLLKNMSLTNMKLVKMYLGVLKNMALVRFQKLKDEKLLSKYLPPILSNFISEPSVIVLLTYISQFYVLPPDVIKSICDQASSKQRVQKVLILAILANYTTLETSQQNIFNLFDRLIQTLIHLYIHCKPYEVKYLQSCLYSILRVMGKFPQNHGEELLKKVEKTKLQDTLIVLLTVSNQKSKGIIFEIEETIIDKCIHQLQSNFFKMFSPEIIDQVLQGIEYTNITIIERCLKIITKLFYYAEPDYIRQVESQHEVSTVLDNLSYHKNQFIAQTAIELRKYLPEDDFYGDMSDY